MISVIFLAKGQTNQYIIKKRHRGRAGWTGHVVANQGAFKLVSLFGVYSEDCLSEASSVAAGKTDKLATGHGMISPVRPESSHISPTSKVGAP